MARISKFNLETFEKILKETDPDKLHRVASEAIEDLIKHAEVLEGAKDSLSVTLFSLSCAALLEARAAYLNTEIIKRHTVRH